MNAERQRTRTPKDEGKPYEFRSNFSQVLEEHGLTHQYFADKARLSMELSDMMAFTRHDIFGPRRVFGKKIPILRRRVAKIISESTKDPRLSFEELIHQGLVMEASNPRDKELMDRVADSLHEIYPDEPITVLVK